MTDHPDAPPSLDGLPPMVAQWAERRRRAALEVAAQPVTDAVTFAAQLVEKLAAEPNGSACRPRHGAVAPGGQPIMSSTTPSQ